ncbi:hypothetical protein DTX80_17775 [Bacilli bacterium]|nr:hypothetical protein WH51_11430 [Bacilli bacterium VT-13-104]PZD83175.1 hypothetical protein DEJ64_16015 [Bacilli bacterium]PZD84287.1 hypothetical protein DEJ60_15035 [Bacilli bacterium]PZD86323.1 hypothetical protein DEJ66_15800 [Bacilli bacterium]RCO04299.1 hypothetical protein DTX80_17775 [Bacilli bacterium]
MKISRKDEVNLPEFSSHEEARNFFKEKYGESFMLTGTDMIDDRKIYFYSLVLDKKAFNEGQEKLQKGEPVTGFDFINSYQPIEIFEDGNIHIIH